MKPPTKRLISALLIPISLLLTYLAHQNPELNERIFTLGIYRFLATTYGRVFGYLPFSVMQFLIIIVPVALVVYIVYEVQTIIKKAIKSSKITYITKATTARYHALRLVANLLCTVGVVLFTFTIFAGLNYARPPIGGAFGLSPRPSYAHELAELTERLVLQVNALSTQVPRDENGLMVTGSHRQLSHQAREIFGAVGENYPVLRGFVPHVKPILYSRTMSRFRISGVYTPWTMEAHVNVDIMPYLVPAIMLHELAHFRGIMREDEANFVAWYVGHHSGDPIFMYSSAMLGLSYAAGQLSRADMREHSRIMAMLCPYAQLDRRSNWEYWQQFQGPLADIGQAVNDTYLRANRQQDGVQSYGRVVDLLLAYFRD